VGRVAVLSLTASLNPSLLAATTLMLLLDRPARLMAGYLLGAYTASITIGLVIVFALPNSGATKTAQHTASPLLDLTLGVLALTIAFVLNARMHERVAEARRARKAGKPDKGPTRWQRELSKGSPKVTFVVGILLTLPGASYLLGLREIHVLDYSTAGTVLLVIGFNVIMLWLLEIPLAAFVFAPDATPRVIERAKAFVRRHALTYAVRGFAIVGVLLIVKGVLGLLH
jgi:hypothetical protein